MGYPHHLLFVNVGVCFLLQHNNTALTLIIAQSLQKRVQENAKIKKEIQ